MKKTTKQRTAIAKKSQQVSDLSNKVKKYPTIAVINLRNLPDDLLQSCRKKLRETDTFIKISKLAVLKRVLETINSDLAVYSKKIKNPSALILTKKTPYQLSSFFLKNKKKTAAKSGQISPFEIIVSAGDTDLPPGPALSDLKNAGVSVQIKAGKIAIIKDSVIAKEGETITSGKAKALQMLGIRPFEVGIEPLFAYDGTYLYEKEILAIDSEKLKDEIIQANCYGTNLSINANIYTSNSIAQLLTLAIKQEMALSNLNKNK